MADTEASFGVLNIVANPHPDGVYIDLLNQVARTPVQFWGSDHATISRPQEVARGFYQGRIFIWTEIDPNEPAIDKRELEEISLEDAGFVPPPNLGFNGRIFTYTFRESHHLMFFEIRNEFGKNLSPRRAEKIFSRLLSSEVLPMDSPFVEVTVIPEDDSLDRILGIHQINRVTINLKRPNADEFGDDVKEILEELEDQGAKSQTLSLSRSPDAQTLDLNDHNLTLAKVAAQNGHVAALGREEDGSKFEGSTLEYPKVIKLVIEGAVSLATAAMRVAQNYNPPRI